MSTKKIALCMAAFVALLYVADVATACPTCAEAMAANDPSHNGMVRGFTYSILFMMGMPFTLLGLFSAMMYREVRKARSADVAQQNDAVAPQYRGTQSSEPSQN